MKPVKFKLCLKGELMSQETISVSISVKSAQAALVVTDAQGNNVADGGNVTLVPETVGVADPGQVVVSVSGGQPPYNFSLSSGSLPDGDSLSSTINADGSETVTLEGTPTTAGDVSFGLLIADSAGATANVTAKKSIQ